MYEKYPEVFLDNTKTKYYQNDQNHETLTSENVGKLAKLNSIQINDLKVLESYNPYPEVMDTARDVAIILPTYVPEGFNVFNFTVGNGWEFYTIFYKNNENLCFGITAYTQEGGAPSEYNTVTAISPHIGEILIAKTGFDEISNSPRVFSNFYNAPTTDDDIYHTVYVIDSPYHDQCKSLPIKEFIKIVESLRFLDSQYLDKDVIFFNDIFSIDP